MSIDDSPFESKRKKEMLHPVQAADMTDDTDANTAPLLPTMRILLQFGKVTSPPIVHDALVARAKQLAKQYRHAENFKAEAMFMRVLQDGLNFGKWP